MSANRIEFSNANGTVTVDEDGYDLVITFGLFRVEYTADEVVRILKQQPAVPSGAAWWKQLCTTEGKS